MGGRVNLFATKAGRQVVFSGAERLTRLLAVGVKVCDEYLVEVTE